MKASALEILLARLYTDETALKQFLANPEEYAAQADLDDADIAAVKHMDLTGLQMAAASYAAKRKQHWQPRLPIYQPLINWLKTLWCL